MKALGLLAAVVIVAACAHDPLDEAAGTEAGLAFGSVEYIADGARVSWSTSWLGGNLLGLFLRDKAGNSHTMRIDGDGDFIWPLPPGDYVIVGYHAQFQGMANLSSRTGRVMAAFSVPRAGHAAYIGELRIETANRSYDVSVHERYADALQRFQSRVAGGKFSTASVPMQFEPPLGRFTRVTPICDPAWALACDRAYQGVRPLQTERAESSWTFTSSLAPLLEWKPSSRADVTYDVVIHESLSFAFFAGTIEGLCGAVVSYAEGLKEPRYAPNTPLEPGRRYQWSVRLRDGDTVSSWSSTSYNWIVRTGSGQYFGFETPP